MSTVGTANGVAVGDPATLFVLISTPCIILEASSALVRPSLPSTCFRCSLITFRPNDSAGPSYLLQARGGRDGGVVVGQQHVGQLKWPVVLVVLLEPGDPPSPLRPERSFQCCMGDSEAGHAVQRQFGSSKKRSVEHQDRTGRNGL